MRRPSLSAHTFLPGVLLEKESLTDLLVPPAGLASEGPAGVVAPLFMSGACDD